VTARALQGMARVRSGQASAWPLSSDRSVRRGSGVKRDFACTFTRHNSPVLVVMRSQSRLRLEGRTRTLSGPSPDLSPARTLAPSAVIRTRPGSGSHIPSYGGFGGGHPHFHRHTGYRKLGGNRRRRQHV